MQTLVNGLVSGAAIALLALAFQIVYLPTRVFFIALAGVYALAPFLASYLLGLGAGWPVAVLVSVCGSIALAIMAERGSHWRLSKRCASPSVQLVASLGMYIVIIQLIVVIWGTNPMTLRRGLDSVSHIGSVVVTGSQWITLGVAGILLSVTSIVLWRSALGLKLRALAGNPVQFSLLGHDVSAFRMLAFGLSALLACGAALAKANDVGFNPYSGLPELLLAVTAVIASGRDSFVTPIVGGMVLGILRSEVAWYWSARWQDAVTFGFLAAALILRPEGLLTRRTSLKGVA